MKKGWVIIIVIVFIVALGLYYFFPEEESESASCAKDGEQFSKVYTDEYPETCCDGLKEWQSGMDTRISIADQCYQTMSMGGNPVGTCIKCGNGICEDDSIYRETVCNCPEDCTNATNSDYTSVEEFCTTMVGTNGSLAKICGEDHFDLPICKLCEW
jgi:hypothetical protein